MMDVSEAQNHTNLANCLITVRSSTATDAAAAAPEST